MGRANLRCQNRFPCWICPDDFDLCQRSFTQLALWLKGRSLGRGHFLPGPIFGQSPRSCIESGGKLRILNVRVIRIVNPNSIVIESMQTIPREMKMNIQGEEWSEVVRAIKSCPPEKRYKLQPKLDSWITAKKIVGESVPAAARQLNQELRDEAIEAQFDNFPV